MIALAYRYAESGGEGEPPAEIKLLRAIERFGVHGVYGRPLTANEIKRMNVSQNIINWFNERATSQNWATWNMEHRDYARILSDASKVANDYGE